MAKKVVKGQQGFTFLELLLVLSIMMILTAVILPFSEKRLQRITEEDALKQFMTTVHETQLYAITNQQRVTLKFEEDGRAYKAVSNDLFEVLSGKFPEGMYRTKHSPLRQLDFANTGYLINTGKITITTQSKGNISVSFQFERGRMIVNE
ncbi:hypothetical protein CSV72_02335 [Sporosarcina sp. P20a]|uniref:competence type IV pilus minor pilin ComGD n=1 Tax=Sporosarcina sp. P20a TaxID=2048256 RepID=UPI000C16C0EC|nr:competence type IV pilus minor pilin ComGD [Sporosarcina sp. P20a]PIC88008.1 hypothetical protein CSV72_02335 [Sporosarcina sp. P20a]